jgi:hypothetical protein
MKELVRFSSDIKYKSILLIFFLVIPFYNYSQNDLEMPPPHPDSEDHFPTTFNYGINFSGLTSGSGHGVNINPSFFYRFKKNLIAIGPNIQRDYFNLSGIQTYYQHDFAANFNQWILFYHMNILYHMKANLGPTGTEQYINIYGNISDFKYNTFEHYMGFGLRKTIAEQLNFESSIGLGAYYTLNAFEQTNQIPFRADNDLSLMLKFGLTYDFKR